MKKLLEKSLKELIPFVSSDSRGYGDILKGIYIKKNEAFATDGFVLVRKKLEDGTGDENESVIVPIAEFSKAMELLSKNKVIQSIIMETNKEEILFNSFNFTIKSKAIEGEFPKIESVYPGGEPKAEICLNAKFLEKICKLAYSKGYGHSNLLLKIYDHNVVFETKNGFSGIIMAIRKDSRFD